MIHEFQSGDPRATAKVTRAYVKAMRPWYRKKRFILAVVLVAMVGGGALLGGDGSGEVAVPTTGPAVGPLVVHTKTFGDEFDANQVAAEKKYNGKLIQLTATISNITDGRLAFSDVTTKGSFSTSIDCKLADPDEVLNLKNGQSVTIVGRVDGQFMGGINLENCSVVK